jgi:hypothetical protein
MSTTKPMSTTNVIPFVDDDLETLARDAILKGGSEQDWLAAYRSARARYDAMSSRSGHCPPAPNPDAAPASPIPRDGQPQASID